MNCGFDSHRFHQMRVTTKVQKEVDVTTDIICNKCGDTCTPVSARAPRGTPVKWIEGVGLVEISEEESFLRGPNAYGLIEAQVSGGYDSTDLEDCKNYTFSLCEPCLGALFKTFKIPPDESSYGP